MLCLIALGRNYFGQKLATGIKVPNFRPDSWAMDMLDELAVQQADACVSLCGVWAVWTERNARVHGETTRTIQQSVKWAIDIAADLSMTGKQQMVRSMKQVQS